MADPVAVVKQLVRTADALRAEREAISMRMRECDQKIMEAEAELRRLLAPIMPQAIDAAGAEAETETSARGSAVLLDLMRANPKRGTAWFAERIFGSSERRMANRVSAYRQWLVKTGKIRKTSTGWEVIENAPANGAETVIQGGAP